MKPSMVCSYGVWTFDGIRDPMIAPSSPRKMETAIETFKFDGLTKTTTAGEDRDYFGHFDPVFNVELLTDGNGKRTPAFIVTVNSPSTGAKISGSSIPTIGESKCILVKHKSPP